MIYKLDGSIDMKYISKICTLFRCVLMTCTQMVILHSLLFLHLLPRPLAHLLASSTVHQHSGITTENRPFQPTRDGQFQCEQERIHLSLGNYTSSPSTASHAATGTRTNNKVSRNCNS